MKLLSRSEELILLAVWHLQDEAYGITIRERLEAVTGRTWTIGAIYVPLDRLTKMGLVTAQQAPPTAERGGRSKRYFRLTGKGVAALQEVRRIHDTMWANLPRLGLGGAPV